MTTEHMLVVDGVVIKAPSTFEWGLQDVSSGDATRDQNAYMYKNRLTQKRKINLAWLAPDREEIRNILSAFNPEYFNVKYYDPLDGEIVEREFYCGDRSAPVKIWTVNNKRYSNVSFNIIER